MSKSLEERVTMKERIDKFKESRFNTEATGYKWVVKLVYDLWRDRIGYENKLADQAAALTEAQGKLKAVEDVSKRRAKEPPKDYLGWDDGIKAYRQGYRAALKEIRKAIE